MGYSPYFLHNFMDIASLSVKRTPTLNPKPILNYKRDPCVHPQWPYGKADIDSRSYAETLQGVCITDMGHTFAQ